MQVQPIRADHVARTTFEARVGKYPYAKLRRALHSIALSVISARYSLLGASLRRPLQSISNMH